MITKTPAPADVAIGTNIRAARVNAGMSQETLGKLVGVTFQQIQKYEKGTNRVGGSRMQKISAALQVSINYLFQGTEQGTQTTAVAYSTDTRKAIAAFESLGRKQRSAALVMLQTMAGIPAEKEADEDLEVDSVKGASLRKMISQGIEAGLKHIDTHRPTN